MDKEAWEAINFISKLLLGCAILFITLSVLALIHPLLLVSIVIIALIAALGVSSVKLR